MRQRFQSTDDVITRAGLSHDWQPTAPVPTVRRPLTSNQHILHLLLTVFTAGLWAPVWLILAIHGNRVPVRS